MEKRAVLKNYGLLGAMLAAMLTGGVTGWLWPAAAGTVRPLGQIFINLMFCVVVPLVFSSIAGAIAGMRSVRRAGRIMGVTVLTFVVTGILAAVLMFLLMKAFPPVLTPWAVAAHRGRRGLCRPRSAAGKFLHRRGFRGPG